MADALDFKPVDAGSFDARSLAARLADERAADIADKLNELEPMQAALVLQALAKDAAIATLDQPELDDAAQILMAMPTGVARAYLAGMSSDRVADVFRDIDKPFRADMLSLLDSETRASVERQLTYPLESAGAIMTTEFLSVPANWTIAEVLHHIRMVERTRETVYSVYVIEPAKHTLLQAVPLRRLVSGDPHANVLAAAPSRKPIVISPLASRDEAVRLISKYDLLAVPVVDGRGHILGIVTVDDIIDTIVRKQTAEVQRFGGVEALDQPYMTISFVEMIRKRAGWLCVLFLSEMLTATAMQGFEDELSKALVLTMFIPLVMSSGGNSGSQATSLLIRALAVQEVRLRDWWRVALRELPAGITLGAILGAIGFVRIVAWQQLGLFDYGEHWLLVALTVGFALIGIVTFGSMSGSMLPFVLRAIGFDPATASAPFVATLVDVAGLVIYFSVALVVLHGTLL